MAQFERATNPTKTRKAAKAALASVAALAAFASPATAKSDVKPKGLYATVQEGHYAAAATFNDGVSCEGAAKGGVVKIRPGENKGTLRFNVSYPAIETECTIPENTIGMTALKSLSTSVYEVLPNGRGHEIARVDVSGNGDEENHVDVRKRTRYHVENYDFCAKPDTQYAVIAETDVYNVPSQEVDMPAQGEIINIDILSGRSQDISKAEIISPRC